MLIGDVALHGADVDVSVSEPGHERGTLAVERGDRPRQRPHPAGRQHVLDAVVLDDHGATLHGVGPGAVDQKRVGQYDHVAKHTRATVRPFSAFLRASDSR
jgi:hypothetical protein